MTDARRDHWEKCGDVIGKKKREEVAALTFRTDLVEAPRFKMKL